MAARVRFGIFDFHPDDRELRREGVPVRLQAQPAQVLAMLVERAGEVVTRDQLRQAVWGTETFVDFDQGLNYCIAQIRAALGDSAESPRFVRTVPKRGYQFVAPVSAPEPSPLVPKRPALKYALPAAIALAIAIVAAVAVVRAIAQRHPPINIAIARFDNETGNAALNAFADGLTDSLVADLTSAADGRFGIIGNAASLRQPRNQRDLKSIGASLNAGYIVLGQVQRSSSHTRVLASLIRLPQQTHIAVVRFDRDITDPLQTESELARLIAAEFSRRIAASSQPASH